MDEQNNIQKESLLHDNNIYSVGSKPFSEEHILETRFNNSGNTDAELNENRTNEEATINSHNVAYEEATINSHNVAYEEATMNSHNVANEEATINSHNVANEEATINSHNVANRDAYYNGNNILRKEVVYNNANNADNKGAYLNGGTGRRNETNPQAYSPIGNQAYNNQISTLERQMLLNHNNPLNITSLSNWTKVMLTALVVLIPGIGQIVGIIFGLVFIANDRDADRRSYGGALITVSIIAFIISAIFWFMFALSFGPELYYY